MRDVARSRESDGGAKPPPGPSHIGVDCVQAAPTKKRGRHKGLSTREKRRDLGRPLPLEWDVKGKTYKEVGSYSSDFSRELGLLVRRCTDPNFKDWAQVPQSVKRRILSNIEDELFDIGRQRYGAEYIPGILRGIDKSCAKKYSEFKNELYNHMKRHGTSKQYDGCTADQWEKAIEYFEQPEVKKRSEINSANRRKLKELSYGGSQSIPDLRYKRRNPETGQLAPIPETWQATHHKHGTGWVSETAKETWEKMKAIRETHSSESTESESTEPPSTKAEAGDKDLSLVQTVFGKRRGHQKGYGRIISTREMFDPPSYAQPSAPQPQPLSKSKDPVIADLQERVQQLEAYIRANSIIPGSQYPPPPSDESDNVGSSL
ncbi:hypothetical protein CsatB_020613 [Cannabis sativa]